MQRMSYTYVLRPQLSLLDHLPGQVQSNTWPIDETFRLSAHPLSLACARGNHASPFPTRSSSVEHLANWCDVWVTRRTLSTPTSACSISSARRDDDRLAPIRFNSAMHLPNTPTVQDNCISSLLDFTSSTTSPRTKGDSASPVRFRMPNVFPAHVAYGLPSHPPAPTLSLPSPTLVVMTLLPNK